MSPLDLKRKKDLSKVTAASVAGSAGFLVATQILSRFIADHHGDSGTRWLAVVPMVALFAVMVLALRGLRRMDELERKIHTEAMALAFLGSILVVFAVEFLGTADLVAFPVLWLPAAMVFCWVIGLVLAIERYR